MICEIVNPSDPYTLETDNFLAAAIGIAIVGKGALGLRCDDPPNRTPILFGWDAWLKEKKVDLKTWLHDDRNRNAVATALESVLIGSVKDRKLVSDALSAIENPEHREMFRAKHHDKKRTSLNDIGAACWQTAKALRGKKEKIQTSAPIILVSRA